MTPVPTPDPIWAAYLTRWDALGAPESETFFRAMGQYRTRVNPAFRPKSWSGSRPVVEASLGAGLLEDAVAFGLAQVAIARGKASAVSFPEPVVADPIAAPVSEPAPDEIQSFFSALGTRAVEQPAAEPEPEPAPPAEEPQPAPPRFVLPEMPDWVRAPYDELARRGLIGQPIKHESFRDYIARVRPGYRFYRHATVMVNILQRVADGELNRVMFFAPPRSGKSELLSRLFPGYYLKRFPDAFLGLCSYGAALANDLSRAARDYYQLGGGPFREDATAVANWLTARGGGMWAAGVGGAITGRGFRCGVIDDCLKDDEAAASELIRHRQTEWYGSTFATREEPDPLTGNPDGAIIVGGTRWNAGDLYGWLLSQETESDAPEHWHIVCFDAIRSEHPPEFPKTCTIEPDWRQPGEALCPERQPLEKLLRIKGRISEYWWNALYQQQPRPLEGTLFKVGKIEIVDALPVGCRKIRYWDKASLSTGHGPRTAGVLMCAAPDNRYYIENAVFGHWSVGEREATIRQIAEIDGYGVGVWTEQEPGSGGKESAENTIRNLAGFLVHADRVTGDKVTRAGPLAAQVEAGNVFMLRGSWNKVMLDELREFPNGKTMDTVDAASGAFNKLAHTKVEWGFYIPGASFLKIVG